MTSDELKTLCTELNGGASIGQTLLFQLLNLSRALVEQKRPWMVLRKTDTVVPRFTHPVEPVPLQGAPRGSRRLPCYW